MKRNDTEQNISSRKQQALQTKQNILDVAKSLFQGHQIQDVSIESIAAAANCSVGNIYHYFHNKQELYFFVAEKRLDTQYQELLEILQEDPTVNTSPLDLLMEFVSRAWSIAVNSGVSEDILIYSLKTPASNVMEINERGWASIILDLIAACKESGDIAPYHSSNEIMKSILLLHRGTLANWIIDREDPLCISLFHRSLRIILKSYAT